MKLQTMSNYAIFFTLIFIVDSSVAFNCDTTLIANDPGHDYNDQVYLADCKIEMQESSPFIISSGHTAKLSAEQIRLDSGFHAQRGSHFHAKLRDCIRNPDKNLGYASWGDATDESWMRPVAEAFVNNFDKQEGLIVELKYDDEDLDPNYDIFNLYLDHSLVAAGKDDDVDYYVMPPIGQFGGEKKILKAEGVDKGMFYFHIGHGGGNPDGPNVRDGEMNWTESILGNCSSDGTATGELRYLWLCSCRSFGHGPPIDDSDGRGDEYDRPSLFDGTSTNPIHANVFARLGPVLSDNMRMACGVSTTAHCGNPNHVAAYLKNAYFNDGLSVAESWGAAHIQRGTDRGDHPLTDISGIPILDSSGIPMIRNIYQTPLCIARGNFNTHDLRSPITDDQRFSEKANPYDEALHIVYWETYGSVVESGTGINVGKSPRKSNRSIARNVNPYVKVAHVVSRENKTKNIPANLEEQIRKLPVLLTTQASPEWFAEGVNVVADEKFLTTAKTLDNFYFKNDTLISKETTRDGRPKVKVDTRAGAVTLAGNRQSLSAVADRGILSFEEYAEAAKRFIDGQGWSESDMGQAVAVKAGLQVMPLFSNAGAQASASKVLKTQKDITFYVGRLIPMESISAKVLGSDNQIVVQMNNDSSIIRASKRWRKILQNIEGVPVKSYENAYVEAVNQLENPGLYKLSTWDWGYKSITDDSRKGMMVVYYVFTFEPLSIVNACIDMPRVIEIQGHILEKFKGFNHQKGQERS